MACLHHSFRLTVEDEFEEVKRVGYEYPGVLAAMHLEYEKNGYDFSSRPIWGGFLLRKHKAPDVVRCMNVWFANVLRHSRRDQLSFDYAARQTGLRLTIHPLEIHGTRFHEWPGRRLKSTKVAEQHSPGESAGLAAVDDKTLVIQSCLFSEAYYVGQFGPGETPPAGGLNTYLRSGAGSTKDPHPLFEHAWYLQQNPDVAAAGLNPLVHFLRFGAKEGRNPSRKFDGSWYLQNNPDVAAGSDNPLVHYVKRGAAENREIRRIAEALSSFTGALPGRAPAQNYSKRRAARNSGLHVHIKCSDSGWILERLATELKKRLDYIEIGHVADPAAPVQYYLNYAEYETRVSPLEFALFTHVEERCDDLQRKFFDVGAAIDVAVCMSKMYAEVLLRSGMRDVVTVSPGVDLDRFAPKLRIGVVGRTYPTGRKGEDLVAGVADLPGVEWHFTGKGWPGESRHLAENEMPDFYRSMDYVLVPSYYEGGPMCVVEALACGTPIVAPPVGWVPEFPHIEFATGDLAGLRRILTELVEKKMALRASVEALTWENFAAAHDELFRTRYDKVLGGS